MRVSQLNTALSRPRLSYGVSPKALGLCWGTAGASSVLIGTSWGWHYAVIPIVLAVLIHALLRWLFHKDSDVFSIYAVYSKLSVVYEPVLRERLTVNFERPRGFGRGIRI